MLDKIGSKYDIKYEIVNLVNINISIGKYSQEKSVLEMFLDGFMNRF